MAIPADGRRKGKSMAELQQAGRLGAEDSSDPSRLRLGLAQYAPSWEDRAGTRARIAALLEDAPETDLLVLPEMSLTGFTMEAERAELDAGDHAFFAGLARSRRSAVCYGGAEEGRNALFLRGRDGALLGRYRKRHLFGLGGEPGSYLRGENAPAVLEWEGWRILPAICYDLRFAYHFWEAASSVDLALVPACWPASRDPHWRTLLKARAIENQFWVAGVNRIGRDPRLAYAGSSSVIDPAGEVVLDAGDAEGLHVVAIDRARVAAQRARFPFLADRLA